MGLALDAMADGVHLHMVTRAGMQIVNPQRRLIGGYGSLLARSIPLIVDLVAILAGIDIASPTDHQALVDALQLLDERRRRTCVAGYVAGIGGHLLGQGLHADQIAASGQQRVQRVLGEIRADLCLRGGRKYGRYFADIGLLVVAGKGMESSLIYINFDRFNHQTHLI